MSRWQLVRHTVAALAAIGGHAAAAHWEVASATAGAVVDVVRAARGDQEVLDAWHD